MFVRGSGYGASPFLSVVMGLILLNVVYLAIVVLRLSMRKRREVRAGYTTVTNQYPEVDQIDPKTGRVVRIAGEVLLTREEYLRRVDLVHRAIDAEQSPSTD